jgi:hypothetical protein
VVTGGGVVPELGTKKRSVIRDQGQEIRDWRSEIRKSVGDQRSETTRDQR